MLAACGQPQQPATYTPEFELNFMRACQAGGSSVAACACIWDKIEAEIPVSEFLAFEQLPAGERATHPLTSQLRSMSTACAPTPAAEGTVP